jgi:GT2 family glycosyltransferase
MRLIAVHASGSNRFMREILESIVFEANRAGVESLVVEDVFPDDDDAAYVVIPHEYFAVVPQEEWPEPSILRRTFALTVEHPGTMWFEISAEQSRRCAQIIDINADSTAELRRRGQPASQFQLGYTEYNDVWRGEPVPRTTDIAYLGSTDAKRDALLAGFAPLWWDRTVRLLIPGHDPKTGNGTDFITGDRKLELLRDTRVLVNIHRDQSRSLEWVRVLEGMTNGAVVFSEHSLDATPLVSGEHFISASAGSLGVVIANALGNEDYLTQLRGSAYQFIRDRLRLSASVEKLLERAESLVRNPGVIADPADVSDPPRPHPRPPAWPEGDDRDDEIPAALARIEEKTREISRTIASVHAELAVGRGVTDVTFESSTFERATPRISVIIPAYEMSRYLGDALASVARSSGVSYEILVHDDGSRISSATTVESFIRDNPAVAVSFVGTVANQGVSAARNALLARARGEMLFSLDADNGVYPSALKRLMAALDADNGAAFAYSAIAVFNNGRPQNLLSARSWDPSLFKYGNYLDNMALYRTAQLKELGGWDPELYNWEDFHLWLRLAEAGKRGVFLPQALCWYRVVAESRSQETHFQSRRIWAEMKAAAPTLLSD